MHNNPYQEKRSAGVSPGLVLAGAAVIVIIFGASSQSDASRRAAALHEQSKALPREPDSQALAQELARNEAEQSSAWDCAVVAGQPVCSPVPGKGFITEDKCTRYCKARARAENRRRNVAEPAANSGDDTTCDQPEEAFCKSMPKANCDAWIKQCPCKCAGVALAEPQPLNSIGNPARPAQARPAAQLEGVALEDGVNIAPVAPRTSSASADCNLPEEPFCKTMPKTNCAAWTKECPCKCAGVARADPHKLVWLGKKPKSAVASEAALAPASATSAECNLPEEPFCKSMPKANCAAWTKECPCKCAGVAKADPNKLVWVGKKPKSATEGEAAPPSGVQAAPSVPKSSAASAECNLPEEPFCKTMPTENCAAWTKECPCKCRVKVVPQVGGVVAGSASDCPNEEEWCRFLDLAKCSKWSANCPCRCK